MSDGKHGHRNTQPSSDQESGPASGFRSFWQKSDETNQPSTVTFVEQDPMNSKRGSRTRRSYRHASSPSTTESVDEDSGPSTAQKRRQQVYQAQKRHRNRKAEYVKSLEEEIARLQHLDALVNSEKNELAHQNQAMRDLLASQSLDIQLESIALHGPSTATDSLSALGGAPLDIRYDPDVGHERVYMDFDDQIPGSDMAWTSESSPQAGAVAAAAARRMKKQTPVRGDSWAALDFILALEWPCKNHVHHPVINPNPESPAAPDEYSGHALTTTAAVYQSALPPFDTTAAAAAAASSSSVIGPPTTYPAIPQPEKRWQLPHSEIDKYGSTSFPSLSLLLPPPPPNTMSHHHHHLDYYPPSSSSSTLPMSSDDDPTSNILPNRIHPHRLVSLSERLELDDDQMTPAQAYSAIRETVPADAYLRPTLEAIKAPLGNLVHCTGIGAILPTEMFWEQLDIALESVKSARPDLAADEEIESGGGGGTNEPIA